jgi:serine protease AprX
VVVSPNPFEARANVSFTLAEASDVRLAVYDVLGREVAVLVDGQVEAGAHTAVFDASSLAAGTYVYRLVAGTQVETGRLTVAR